MKLSVLGSTGSIGESTLSVVEYANAETDAGIEVEALIAASNAQRLAEQARQFHAKIAVIADEGKLAELRSALSGTGIAVAAGRQAVLEAAARPVDRCMAAISGTAGLEPTFAALKAGNTILLANKEAMVCAGPLLLQIAKEKGVDIVPVDSEHNAVFQVYQTPDSIERITLTASGGPFRTSDLETMRRATPADALNHPKWDMGAKNSLDSATMMNKGLELIEAAYMFDIPESRIDVLIHPQSIIHSLVSYADGSVLAQMGEPDMRTPIAYALSSPGRLPTEVKRLNLADLARLDFAAPDHARFPAIELARQASREGMLGTSVYNAANEAAGKAFLCEKCGFLDIAEHVRFAMDEVLDRSDPNMPVSVDQIDDALEITEQVFRLIQERVR